MTLSTVSRVGGRSSELCQGKYLWPWPLSSSKLELDFEDGDGEEGCFGAE